MAGTGDGWHLTGAWGNNGTFMMTACSTDRNTQNGFYCNATGSYTPVMLTNCRFNRDGRNGEAAAVLMPGCRSPPRPSR